MSKHIFLCAGLIVSALMLGAAGGYAFSPAYQATMYERGAMDFGPADRLIDLRYLRAMAKHHQGAIKLAEQARDRSQRPEIIALSQAILADEPKLIKQLDDWRSQWYRDRQPRLPGAAVQLPAAGPDFDLAFLNALIAHHQDGIAMAKEIRGKSSRPEVLNDALAVENFLTGSLVQLKAWRADWYQL